MNKTAVLFALAVALTLGACNRSHLPGQPASAQLRVLTHADLAATLDQLRDVDFERLAIDQEVANPLRLEGLTFRDPFSLQSGFCSSPTCEPDPDNDQGGNVALFLNPGGSVSFPRAASQVVLDLQGNGDNPFVLAVIDGNGVRSTVSGQGVLFGVTLLEVTAAAGVARIELESMGGTGGPISVARVLFTLRPA